MKRVYALEAWCVDCKRCEVACKASHVKSHDIVSAVKSGEPLWPRVRVEGDSHLSIAVNCRHCPHPKCVEGCISGAMRNDPLTGVVTSDADKCVGCATCVSMCPVGAVWIRNGKALKCDLCGDGAGVPGDPACVAACPNKALVYVESEV